MNVDQGNLPTSKLRLMILDDHAIVRDGLRLLLAREPDIEVVAEAASLGEAVAAGIEDPHIVLADLVLPDGTGADVVTGLAARFPTARILVLTMVDETSTVRQVMAAGAHGYILKESAATELVGSIRRISRGEGYMQPSLGAALARSIVNTPAHAGRALTARQADVLRLIALGHTNTEIAEALGVALRTVETHRAHVLVKLGLRTRADLVRAALDRGLV